MQHITSVEADIKTIMGLHDAATSASYAWLKEAGRANINPTTTRAAKNAETSARMALEEKIREVISQDLEVWTILSDRMPEKRIRVLAAQNDFVVGDCFYGAADVCIGDCDKPGYLEERAIECWRYTEGGRAVAEHLQPTQWMSLPTPQSNLRVARPAGFISAEDAGLLRAMGGPLTIIAGRKASDDDVAIYLGATPTASAPQLPVTG